MNNKLKIIFGISCAIPALIILPFTSLGSNFPVQKQEYKVLEEITHNGNHKFQLLSKRINKNSFRITMKHKKDCPQCKTRLENNQ